MCLPWGWGMGVAGRSPPPHVHLSPAIPPEGILAFLKDSKPGDALCVLGLTLSDLYPCEAWSFTFGAFLPGHGELASHPGQARASSPILGTMPVHGNSCP